MASSSIREIAISGKHLFMNPLYTLKTINPTTNYVGCVGMKKENQIALVPFHTVTEYYLR